MIDWEWKWFSISTQMAGWITFAWTLHPFSRIDHQCIAIHLFPKKHHRQYGLVRDWYDGPMYSLGLGPLCLITWILYRTKIRKIF